MGTHLYWVLITAAAVGMQRTWHQEYMHTCMPSVAQGLEQGSRVNGDWRGSADFKGLGRGRVVIRAAMDDVYNFSIHKATWRQIFSGLAVSFRVVSWVW